MAWRSHSTTLSGALLCMIVTYEEHVTCLERLPEIMQEHASLLVARDLHVEGVHKVIF